MHSLRTLPPRLPHLLLSCTTSGQSKLQTIVIFITSQDIFVSSPFPEGCHILELHSWKVILDYSSACWGSGSVNDVNAILNFLFLALDDLGVLILCFQFSLHRIITDL